MNERFRNKVRALRLNALIFLLLSVVSCSFHSNQWTAIRNLLEEPNFAVPKQWLLSLGTEKVRVYPIQMDESVLFSDGKSIFITFDGWHIVKVISFGYLGAEDSFSFRAHVTMMYNSTLPASDSYYSVMNSREAMALFFEKDKIIYTVQCDEWTRKHNNLGELLAQSCVFDGKSMFSNTIELDRSGNIVALSSVVGPRGTKLRLAAVDY